MSSKEIIRGVMPRLAHHSDDPAHPPQPHADYLLASHDRFARHHLSLAPATHPARSLSEKPAQVKSGFDPAKLEGLWYEQHDRYVVPLCSGTPAPTRGFSLRVLPGELRRGGWEEVAIQFLEERVLQLEQHYMRQLGGWNQIQSSLSIEHTVACRECCTGCLAPRRKKRR